MAPNLKIVFFLRHSLFLKESEELLWRKPEGLLKKLRDILHCKDAVAPYKQNQRVMTIKKRIGTRKGFIDFVIVKNGETFYRENTYNFWCPKKIDKTDIEYSEPSYKGVSICKIVKRKKTTAGFQFGFGIPL